MATTAKLTTPDNGYFQIWARPCGHRVRVTTEDSQWSRRDRTIRARLDAATRQRLSSAACSACDSAARSVTLACYASALLDSDAR